MTSVSTSPNRRHAYALRVSARSLGESVLVGFAEAARHAVRHVGEALGDECCVSVVDEADGPTLRTLAHHGGIPSQMLTACALDDTRALMARAARHPGEWLEDTAGEHAVLAAPIRLEAAPAGVFCLLRRADPFHDEDRDFVTALAACAGLALRADRDTQARRRAEQSREAAVQRQHEAEMAAATAAEMRDDFLATISHELRTPLNAIVGWVHILGNTSPTPELLARAVPIIKRNAEAEAKLVDDLLDVAALMRGRVMLEATRVDIEDVAHAAMAAVGLAARAREIKLSAVVGPGLPVVLGDRERLQQVLWNLLSNAVKFCGRGGHVALNVLATAGGVRVSVQDDGQGITREMMPLVFEPFRQADSTMVRIHGGLGVGLALVKHIVEGHGGRVAAHSEGLGRGALFVVDLPAAPAASSAAIITSATAVDLRGVSVLLALELPSSFDALRLALTAQGAVVTPAATSEAALDELTSGPGYDVLLAEVDALGSEALELIRAVRTLAPERGGTIPAVAITRLATAENRVRALSAGFDHYVARPLHPTDVAAAVLRSIGRGAGARH